MAYAIMRFAKIKSVATANTRLMHNRRQLKESRTYTNPDAKNKALFLDGNRDNKDKNFREIFKVKTDDQKIRKNAVVAVESVFAFSPGSISPENYKSWAAETMHWAADLFGKNNIIDAQIHLDESNPHIHVISIPIDERGRLNCRAFLGGSSKRLSELQTSYAERMKQFSLERGVSKEITHRVHESHKRWITEQAVKENRLETYEKVFGTEREWDFDTFKKFKVIENELNTSDNALDAPKSALIPAQEELDK